jgi:hypothetical protein
MSTNPMRQELRRIYGDPPCELTDELQFCLGKLSNVKPRLRRPGAIRRLIRFAMRRATVG